MKCRIADAHYDLKNYSEAIRVAEPLLPVAKFVLEDMEQIRCILWLLWHAYKYAGDSERARHYRKEIDALKKTANQIQKR